MPEVTQGLFITATGTDVGKTVITAALTLALRAAGRNVVAVKPAETDCNPVGRDAEWLAKCCGQPALANAHGFCRLSAALAPAAAALLEQTLAPNAIGLAAACLRLAPVDGPLLVEGAGGVLVPLNEHESMADLARALGLPILLVAADELGTLSHTLTAYEALVRRGLSVRAIALNRTRRKNNDETMRQMPSAPSSNLMLLRARLPIPVFPFPALADNTQRALIDAAHASELLHLLDGTSSA